MKPKAKHIFSAIRKFGSKHSPEILTGLAITSGLVCFGLTIQATVRSVHAVDRRKEELLKENPDIESKNDISLSRKEIFLLSWKNFIWAGTAAAAGTAFMIGTAREGVKRGMAAVAMSETADLFYNELETYKKAAVKTIGRTKEEEIETAVARDKVIETDYDPKEVIETGRGNTLCYDYWGGRYFRTDINDLYRGANVINKQMMDDGIDGCAPLNDYYEEIGLYGNGAGKVLGFRADRHLIEVKLKSILHERTQEPAVVLTFVHNPKSGFDNYYDAREYDGCYD